MGNQSPYKDIFLEEANEQIELLNQYTLELEHDPKNKSSLFNVFRMVHTLKSSSAFVGLTDFSSFLHKLENLLQKLSDGVIEINETIVTLLFKCFDQLKVSIDEFSETDKVQQDYSTNLKQILLILEHGSDAIEIHKETSAPPKSTKADVSVLVTPDLCTKVKEEVDFADTILWMVKVIIDPNAALKWIRAQLVLNNLEKIGKVHGSSPDRMRLNKDHFSDTLLILFSSHSSYSEIYNSLDVDQVMQIDIQEWSQAELESFCKTTPAIETKVLLEAPTPEKQEIQANEITAESQARTLRSQQSQTVRVPINKLDELMNWVGELAIVNAGFFEITQRYKDRIEHRDLVADLESKIDNLNRISRNLQEGIMNSRMVPISTVFSRFTRIIRDLSHEMDKPIHLELIGEDTELDKKIVDALGEPLIHLVRNAIDHGIEKKEERKRLNKPELGKILMNAFQQGGRIFIEVSDDGKGLDKNTILEKALEKNLIPKEKANSMSENEIFELIFLPGFSTKEQVSEISGRGVGMGVVEETLKNLNGSIQIRSEQGKGTTFSLIFPLTLAIISVLLIADDGETYAIPLLGINEAIHAKQEKVETVDQRLVVRLRNHIIPVVKLSQLLGYSDVQEAQKSIVILDYENSKVGIMIENLIGKREVVVKALDQDIRRGDKSITGAAILGNGQIALILDTTELIKNYKENLKSANRHDPSI